MSLPKKAGHFMPRRARSPTGRGIAGPSRHEAGGILMAAVILALATALRMDTHAAESHVIDRSWPADSAACRPGRFQVPGVALAGDGSVLVLTRGVNHWMPGMAPPRHKLVASPVFDVSATGDRAQPGPGARTFVMPHQIAVDRQGHIWIVDAGLHRVVEFDKEGRKVGDLGGPKVRFNMPTDIAFLSDGTFVVADGYGNSRVVRFTSDYEVVASWGRRGGGRMEFQIPHSVAVDDHDRIYVADRDNDRIQVLTADGVFLAEWNDVGRPLTVRFAAGSVWVLSNFEAGAGIVRRLTPAGEELESFHTLPPGDGGDFEWPHGLAVSADGADVYVGFALTGRRVQRYRRVASGPGSP